MHPALEAIRQATLGTSFEGELWLVGGAVRDELLGIPHEADFDIVLVGASQDLAKFLHERGVSSIYPVTYERFGTAMVRVEDVQIELVTARRESYESGSRKPTVEPATLQEDALRRDFTVNTLMRNLHSEKLLDPLGRGLSDLKDRILRTPLDPKETFYDDPLRMLRAVRFRWKLRFQPAPGLCEAVREEAKRLKIISGERIRDELVKMLMQPWAPEALSELMDVGLIDQFAPELRQTVGVDQGNYHHLDVWNHCLLVLTNVLKINPNASLTLRLAALLHDVGKPGTRKIEEGRVRTIGHEKAGAKIAEKLLRRLKFPVEEIGQVTTLVANHSRLGYDGSVKAPNVRRIIRDLGDLVPDFLDLVEADRASHKPGIPVPDMCQARDLFASVEKETPRRVLESPLEGGEIMELLSIPPGPDVGKWKTFLTEKVLDGEIPPGDKSAAKAALLRAVADSSAS